MPEQTPSQTVGPFFHRGLPGENMLVNDHTAGQRIEIIGQVLDGDGQPVPDALIEIWQADSNGYFNHPADPNHARADKHFRGHGRSDTINGGMFRFATIKPGRVPGREGTLQAPHLNVCVFARGMLIQAVTRLYFSDESANETDPVLNMLEDPRRRGTLIAVHQADDPRPTYRFDIRLQGEDETVFFEPS